MVDFLTGNIGHKIILCREQIDVIRILRVRILHRHDELAVVHGYRCTSAIGSLIKGLRQRCAFVKQCIDVGALAPREMLIRARSHIALSLFDNRTGEKHDFTIGRNEWQIVIGRRGDSINLDRLVIGLILVDIGIGLHAFQCVLDFTILFLIILFKLSWISIGEAQEFFECGKCLFVFPVGIIHSPELIIHFAMVIRTKLIELFQVLFSRSKRTSAFGNLEFDFSQAHQTR